MKKVLINTRILAIALAATFTTAFSSPALAIEEKKTIPVELKFVGNIGDQPVFLLNFTNSEENEYTIVVRDEIDRPQPKLDRDAGNGMTVTVGRLREDTVLDYRFVVLSHNTIRGAAGAAVLNAELLIALGHL